MRSTIAACNKQTVASHAIFTTLLVWDGPKRRLDNAAAILHLEMIMTTVVGNEL